ncbi:hypothetical protein BDZ45DRAFT_745966 [Acephala macrosclerotiorum]|nr:hypothetical protein BDZ45DRAFT_745966 [Acephala macrosclerotiorum]
MYQPVKDNDSLNNDREDEEFLLQHHSPTSPWRRFLSSLKLRNTRHDFDPSSSCIANLSVIIATINCLLFIAAITVLFHSYQNTKSIETNSNNRLIKLTSTYSPIFDKLPISFTNIHTNGSFWPQNPPSLFQLPPSPDVDAAWERLADTHALAFTASEMIPTGKNPSELWPWPSSYNIPNHPNPNKKTYMALPNVFHQIHCLNMFRKLAHKDYYGEFWTHTDSFPFEAHLGHCQYMLLQALMCHADMEMITFGKVRGTPGPFPDFSVEQKCRDFEGILRWKEENQVNVSDEEWKLINVTPEGIKELDPVGRTLPLV